MEESNNGERGRKRKSRWEAVPEAPIANSHGPHDGVLPPTGFQQHQQHQPVDYGSGGSAKRMALEGSGGEVNGQIKINVPSFIPTIVPTNATADEQEAILIQVKINEYNEKLKLPQERLAEVIPDRKRTRSLSPEPVYDGNGRRVNTRVYRYCQKWAQERDSLAERLKQLHASGTLGTQIVNQAALKALSQPSKPKTYEDRIFIPTAQYPEVNFVGLIIGPRGSNLRKLEAENGCKIMIRGKGSIREGKGVNVRSSAPALPPSNTNNNNPAALALTAGVSSPGGFSGASIALNTLPEGFDEELHAIIRAPTAEAVQNGIRAVEKIIEIGTTEPDKMSDLKRMQLRELAVLNGTLREDPLDEGFGTAGSGIFACDNCGSREHKTYVCPEKKNITLNLKCVHCHGFGHLSKDCKFLVGPAGAAAGVGAVGGPAPSNVSEASMHLPSYPPASHLPPQSQHIKLAFKDGQPIAPAALPPSLIPTQAAPILAPATLYLPPATSAMPPTPFYYAYALGQLHNPYMSMYNPAVPPLVLPYSGMPPLPSEAPPLPPDEPPSEPPGDPPNGAGVQP